jgi:hypothetical protein
MNDPILSEAMGEKARSSIQRFSSDKIGEDYYSLLTFAV